MPTATSHHVSQIGPKSDHCAFPVAQRLVTPMVALTTGLIRAAQNPKRKTSRSLSNACRPLA